MKFEKKCVCKRIALHMTQEDLAKHAGLSVDEIVKIEDGSVLATGKQKDRIDKVLFWGFKNIPEIDHYRARIAQLGLQINEEDNIDDAMLEISHMLIELGRLQQALVEKRSGKRFAGETVRAK